MGVQKRGENWGRIRTVSAGVLCVLALALPLDATECSDPAWQIRRLKRDVGSLQLLNMLDLSATQKVQLLPLVQKAVAAETAVERSLADLAPEMLDAYKDFKVQAQKNMGFTAEVTERAEDCHRLEREMKTQVRAQAQQLEGQVRAILTPDQLAFVESYGPQGGGRRGAGSSRGGKPQPPEDRSGRNPRDSGRRGMGEWTNISQFILCPAALSFLDSKAQNEMMPLDKPEVQAMMGQLLELESDMTSLNLINGLNLTTAQMQQLVVLAQQAAGGRREADLLRAEKQALAKAKRELVTNGEMSYATRELLRSAASGRGPTPPGPGRTEMSDPGAERLANKVEELLTTEQRQVLSAFRPCVIPPQNQRDPVRAGQAENTSRFADFIERLRRGPEGRAESIVQQLVTGDEEQYMGPRTPEQRQERIAQLLAIVRKARAMSDTEFAMSKVQLAQEAQPAPPPNRLATRPGRDPARAAIADYLLNERIVPLLKERMESNK